MGFFDGNKGEQLKFLEEERQKLWDRLTKLEKQNNELKKELDKKTPELVTEIRGLLLTSSGLRNKIEKRYNEVEDIIEDLYKKVNEFTEGKKLIDSEKFEIDNIKSSIEESSESITKTETSLNSQFIVFESKLSKLNEIIDKYPDFDEELSRLEDFITEIETNTEKSETTLNEVNKKKREIDNIHRTIFGYTQKNEEEGTETKIEGLKDELDDAYDSLAIGLEESENRLEKINEEYQGKYKEYLKNHEDKYKKVLDEIKGLLPNAMTAGLSSAFSSKKGEELKLSKDLQTKFNVGIGVLVFISLIPLWVSLYFLNQGTELIEVINRIPRIVLAIIPMYIPALWFTVSASKKLNLSKRLIEEYSHKEVLSKTYEGLNNQISNITDKAQSEELKFRLLTNFLQVTSENPGKLISNYETSDHPVMEALEQSYKFQVAISKLESIPGMGKVAAILEKKAKKRLDDRKVKIDEGFTSQEEPEKG